MIEKLAIVIAAYENFSVKFFEKKNHFRFSANNFTCDFYSIELLVISPFSQLKRFLGFRPNDMGTK